MKEKFLELWKLFITFARIGSVTFGGGYAMLPILQRDIVYTLHWAEEEELMDYFAVGQCTPGIIAVNTATFIGQKRAGTAGGIAATLGMIFPSLVIISLIAGFISNFSDLPWVKNAFAGIQVCVCVLIANAVMKLLKKAVIDQPTACLFALALAGSVALNLSPVWFVLFSGFAGAAVKTLEAKYEQYAAAHKHDKTDSPWKRRKTTYSGGNTNDSGKNADQRNADTDDSGGSADHSGGNTDPHGGKGGSET